MFMPNNLTRIQTDNNLPSSTEVLVIGGGIVGVSAALSLTDRGIPVVLVEKGVIAGEQSSRNWGWCRQQGRDSRELPLMMRSMRIWQEMNQRVGAETGFRQCGVAYLAKTINTDAQDTWLANARLYGIDSRIMTGEKLHDLLPNHSASYRSALFTASDGRAEPTLAVPAMASRAREKGAIILEGTAARGIETENGSVCGVITEKGRVDCKAVLVAGGVWSRLFCRPLAIDVPQLKILSSVMRTHPIKGCPEVSVSGHGFAFRKRLDGGYTVANGNIINYELVPDSLRFAMQFLPLAWKARKELRLRFSNRFGIERRESNLWSLDQPGPFETTRILNPNPVRQELHSAKQNLISAYPSFGELQVAEEWAGMIDVTPDAIPIISAVPNLAGLFLATGFSGHGFGLGPAAGELAVDLVTNSEPIVDPQPFVLSRFFDGSRVRPVIGI